MPPVRFALPALNRVTPSSRAALLHPTLVVLLSILALAPLTYPGSFQTQTGLLAVYNLMDLHAQLGSIFTWSAAFGRGFDLLRMDGALAYYAAEVLHLVGLSFLDAIKVIYALTFALSALGMFYLARRIFANDLAGILAALVYLYFPYHLAVVYVRGAFGEAGAWALFPFALLALDKLQARSAPTRREYLPSILLFVALALAQPGLALLFGVYARVWCLVLASGKQVERGFWRSRVANSIVAGLAIGCALWLPALFGQNGARRADGFTPAFVYPFQFLTASWGAALPTGNYLDQFPFQIGSGALGLTIFALALVFRRAPNTDAGKTARRVVLCAAIVSALLLLLMMPYSAWLWGLTQATALVQYPFQLLAFVGIALAIAAGAIVVSDARFAERPLFAALVVIPILAVYPYLAPEFLDLSPTRLPRAVFNDNEIALVDYKIVRPPGVFRHGATVQLNLWWQALRPVNHDYTVFLHVVDEEGKAWGGADAKPQGGALPTTKWQSGRVVTDTHSVQIDLAGPPEGYHLELGLYRAANGERAVTEAGATEVRIDENR